MEEPGIRAGEAGYRVEVIWYLEGLPEKLMCTLQIERAALAI